MKKLHLKKKFQSLVSVVMLKISVSQWCLVLSSKVGGHSKPEILQPVISVGRYLLTTRSKKDRAKWIVSLRKPIRSERKHRLSQIYIDKKDEPVVWGAFHSLIFLWGKLANFVKNGKVLAPLGEKKVELVSWMGWINCFFRIKNFVRYFF